MNCFEDYKYEINRDESVEIIRYESEKKMVFIPDRIDGLPVTSIHKQAFMISDAAEIHVPEGVETIGEEAFAACDELERVYLPASLKTLAKGVFKGSEKLRQIVFEKENARYFVEDGVLYDRDEAALLLCPPGLETETITVPMGIRSISSGAFYANRALELVNLPLTLKKIETEAFLFTSAMRIISLPPYIEEIEPCAFLLGSGIYAEKLFEIYAFPDTVGYRYAEENQIPVHPLYAIVTD